MAPARVASIISRVNDHQPRMDRATSCPTGPAAVFRGVDLATSRSGATVAWRVGRRDLPAVLAGTGIAATGIHAPGVRTTHGNRGSARASTATAVPLGRVFEPAPGRRTRSSVDRRSGSGDMGSVRPVSRGPTQHHCGPPSSDRQRRQRSGARPSVFGAIQGDDHGTGVAPSTVTMCRSPVGLRRRRHRDEHRVRLPDPTRARRHGGGVETRGLRASSVRAGWSSSNTS